MKLVVTMREERRSAARQGIALEARVGDENVSTSTVLLEDISIAGFLMISGGRVTTGDRVDIVLPIIGEKRATVVRQNGHRAGCAFIPPLSLDELRHVTDAGLARLALLQQRAKVGWRPDAETLAA